jgi:hypothetical protein
VCKAWAVAECLSSCSQRVGKVHGTTSVSASGQLAGRRRQTCVQILDHRNRPWPVWPLTRLPASPPQSGAGRQ